jgi:predicted N-acetyltransferase YhbS
MINSIELLQDCHNVDRFDCGSLEQNNFLQRKAVSYGRERNANTFVIVDESHVVAFYSICMASIAKELAGQHEPHRIPCILLAQLGVDKEHQKKGYSSQLIFDCFNRAVATATNGPACRYVLVDMKEEKLTQFYEKFGFRRVNKSDKRTSMHTMIIGVSQIIATKC